MKPTLYLLLASVIFLAACAAPTPTPAPAIDPAGSTMPALTDPSQPILVNAGETFFIVLESNPSTGYHWEMVDPLDEAHFELISREYTAAEPVMPGSGGVDVWIFKAVSSGETQVTLGSFPPDANVTEPEQTTAFMVTIK